MNHNKEIGMGSDIQVWLMGRRVASGWGHGFLVPKAMSQAGPASQRLLAEGGSHHFLKLGKSWGFVSFNNLGCVFDLFGFYPFICCSALKIQ